MVVDVGGGTSEVAVISLGGIVLSRSVRVGGYEMDEAITHYLRGAHQLAIGSQTAEAIKIASESAVPLEHERTTEVRGRHLITGISAAALALAGCGSSQPSTSSAAAPAAGKGVAQSATACAAQAGSQTVATAAHYFVVHMGPQEAMYSPGQVRSMHPKSGEVMVGGAMGAGTSMSGAGACRGWPQDLPRGTSRSRSATGAPVP
jgi:MreB/Mbl protein